VGLTGLGIVATAMALAAAFLNAAFGFCLGCELYGLIGRFRSTTPQQTTPQQTTPHQTTPHQTTLKSTKGVST
jgi:hypothetical protein